MAGYNMNNEVSTHQMEIENNISNQLPADPFIDQFKNDNDFRQTILNSKTQTELPEGFEEKFLNLLNEMEHLTNKAFTLTIHELGSMDSLKIKPFETRPGYIVSNMKDKYKDLNGEYNSVDEIKQKIMKLKYKNVIHPDGKSWICPKCNNDSPNKSYKPINEFCAYRDCCQFCGSVFNSMWDNVSISLEHQEIYTSCGGSLSICHPIGKISIKKN